MNWNILQRWKIFHFYWKKFHSSENIFTLLDFQACQNSVQMKKLENFPLWWKKSPLPKICKKKFFLQNCMNWNILRRSKIFHFWWKIFHFGEILFSASRPSRLPNSIPNREIGIFSTLVENFPLTKMCTKKKFFFAELHELEHSAEVENFPLLVEKFPLW